MKTKTYGLLLSLLLFAIFTGLTFMFKSIHFLYIASVCPLLVVPFLPDIRSAQYIRRGDAAVRLISVQGKEPGPSDLFVLWLEPGFIQWQRTRLYFDVRDAVPYPALPHEELAASMAVLPFDLKPHPRNKYMVGITLSHLQERLPQLSVTTQEINRLIIRTSDLQELLGHKRSQPAAAGRRLQA